MATSVDPLVTLVGETQIIPHNMGDYLEHIGAPEWDTHDNRGTVSDCEKLVEFMGRLCYRSFKPGLNPNVAKVREGNDVYLDNILNVDHGSVLEHVNLNFVFKNVSRVFTHELVRHRVGVAISQESLRYVRLNRLEYWMPSCIAENPKAAEYFRRCFDEMESWQEDLAAMFEIDEMTDFGKKKELTSAFRRIAPIGLATAIGWSCNIRTLRHVLLMRTNRAAEEEIRAVFSSVWELVTYKYPNFFLDMTATLHKEYWEVTKR